MKFEHPLLSGKFLKRYKRFFADIERSSGEIVVAHVPNTGTMKTCIAPGWEAWMMHHDSPTRKLKYTLELINNGQSFIGVNTARTNAIAMEGIKAGILPHLANEYPYHYTESTVGESRIDLVLSRTPLDSVKFKNGIPPELKKQLLFIEVKNVTLKNEAGEAAFPDAVTTRGHKHLEELIELKAKGIRAAMLFVVSRGDVEVFNPNSTIDLAYSMKLKEAKLAGVEIWAYQCQINSEQIALNKSIPILF